jgi:hypothetical protein
MVKFFQKAFKIIGVLVLLVTLLSSCMKIMLKVYGVKKPRVENATSVKKKTLKFGLDTSNLVTVKSEAWLKTLKGQKLPDIAVFDSAGNYVEYRPTDTSCNAEVFDFIPGLKPDLKLNRTGKTDLKTELSKFRDLKGREFVLNEKADFYVLIFYTVWLGRLNKDHVKVWEDNARANKNCKIKVLKVNLDIQEYWDKIERDKIIDILNKSKKS